MRTPENLAEQPGWRDRGVRIVHANELDPNTPQTPGMSRAAAIDFVMAGARKLWAGTVSIDPKARTRPHHHGLLESVIYVVSGRARMRWGEALEFTADASPGDFILVPPLVPHQEMNASAEPLECVIVRSDQEPVVVNLDLAVVDEPEEVEWVDTAHPPRSTTHPLSASPVEHLPARGMASTGATNTTVHHRK
jgi:uncharacterized RmlC-like cupin family protein